LDRNPYAPPEAQVADPSPERPIVARPLTVTRAVQLMWVAMGLGVVNLVFSWETLTALEDVPAEAASFVKIFVVVVLALSFGFYALIIWKMGQGRHWARVVLMIMLLLSLLTNPFARGSQVGVVAATAGILAFVLEVIAVVLVFLSASEEYFQRRRPR
jgi:hypothetical protein